MYISLYYIIFGSSTLARSSPAVVRTFRHGAEDLDRGLYIYIYIYIHTCMYKYKYIYIYTTYISTCVYLSLYIYIHVYT